MSAPAKYGWCLTNQHEKCITKHPDLKNPCSCGCHQKENEK